MKKRTVLVFNFRGDFWEIISEWAEEDRFRLKEESGGGRIYQKGVGFFVAPMMLKAEQAGTDIRIEAWIRANIFVRAMSLFILPAEMEIQSGGFRGAAPRSIARKSVNKLLAKLGQSLIP